MVDRVENHKGRGVVADVNMCEVPEATRTRKELRALLSSEFMAPERVWATGISLVSDA